jgi:DNA (cytosine-5)-methyltransferase 1
MIVDLFAGPGGWATGLHSLGLTEVGLEWDRWAAATRVAAGHRATIRCDVSAYPTTPFAGRLRTLIASPPCQPYTAAGTSAGLGDLAHVTQAVEDLAHGSDTRAALKSQCADERSILAAEPMRWIHDLRPETVLLEQVPAVLPLWRQYAGVLAGWGYSVWCDTVDAADYGIPQNRRRAVLAASRIREVAAPAPTHSRHGDLLAAPWRTMADALDIPADWTLKYRRDSPKWVAQHGPRPDRLASRPAPAITGEAHRWKWLTANGNLHPLEAWQAGALQGFPDGYPWQGPRTRQMGRIGDAVPPLLAAHIAAAGLGLDLAERLADLGAAA